MYLLNEGVRLIKGFTGFGSREKQKKILRYPFLLNHLGYRIEQVFFNFSILVVNLLTMFLLQSWENTNANICLTEDIILLKKLLPELKLPVLTCQ